MTDIYCLATSKPSGWQSEWRYDCNAIVHWRTGCAHKNTETERKDATCTEAGYVDVICKDCGETISHTLLPATGHKYADGVCTDCGAKEPSYTPDEPDEPKDPNDPETPDDPGEPKDPDDPGTELSTGDINGNGKIDATDYLILKRAVLGTFTLTEEQKAAADINGDEKINSVDYMLLKRVVLGTYKM